MKKTFSVNLLSLDGSWVHNQSALTEGNNSSVSNETFWNPLDATPTLQMFFIACLALQCTFGTIGNLLVMGAVCVVPALRTTGNAFIVNLSLADLCVTAVTQPSNIIGPNVFSARGIIRRAVVPGAASNLFRYILICHFEAYDKIYTRCGTAMLCAAVWVFIYMVELPNHVGWGDNRFSVVFYVCTFANHVHSYAIFYIGLGVLIPVLGSFLAYLGIFIKVRKSSLARRLTRSRVEDGKLSRQELSKHKKRRRVFHENVKVAQALFRVYVIFILMWLPVAILIVMGKGKELAPVWYILTILLAHGNSSINCVVYAASIDHFKDGYCQLLGIRRKYSRKNSRPLINVPATSLQICLTVPVSGKAGSSYNFEMTDLTKTADLDTSDNES